MPGYHLIFDDLHVIDIILFPLYVYLFHRFFAARRKRLNDATLQKYHKYAFWAKVVGTVAFTIFYGYITTGDSSSLYYPEGLNMCHLILKNPSHNFHLLYCSGDQLDPDLLVDPTNISYFMNQSNLVIAQLVVFFSFFSFGSYIVMNLFFSLIAFSGMWKLFMFFYEQYPRLHKQIAIATLFLPSLVFWSSGILKDSVCIGMLGWLAYSLYHLLYKIKQPAKNIIALLFSAFAIYIIKPYILFSFIPFFILSLILLQIQRIKNIFLKITIGILILVGFISAVYVLSDKLKDEMGVFALESLTDRVQSQQETFKDISYQAESSFSLGVDYDGSFLGMFKIAPAAIVATLFRPFLWESRKISTLLSSLEGLGILILSFYVLFKVGPFRFVSSTIRDPMILFCFFFSLVFAVFVGTTTLNFGTLVRYKIPCLPFYVIALFLILDRHYQKIAAKKAIQYEI